MRLQVILGQALYLLLQLADPTTRITYVTSLPIDPAVIEKERDFLTKEALASGKPENIVENSRAQHDLTLMGVNQFQICQHTNSYTDTGCRERTTNKQCDE